MNTASRNSLNRGINYIAERWESIDAEQDTYTLAIVTHALHQANHPQKDGAFRLLDSVAKTDKEGKTWGLTTKLGHAAFTSTLNSYPT